LKRTLLSTLLFLLFLAGCAQPTSTPLEHKVSSTCLYYSQQRAECLTQEQFMQTLKPYKVIFVGDHHDSMTSRAVLLEIIEEMAAAGDHVILANEWFTPEDDPLLQQYVEGKLDDNISKALGWKKRVGYDFNLSEPIYSKVISVGGELKGINLSKTFKKKISDANVSGMSDAEKEFYKALDLNVTAHKQMLSPFFQHCHGDAQQSAQACAERMYRVQVAWDTKMALESAKLASKLKEHERLIVFVGAMHLEQKLGINLRFSRLSQAPFITIIPWQKGSGAFEMIDHGSSDIDYLYP